MSQSPPVSPLPAIVPETLAKGAKDALYVGDVVLFKQYYGVYLNLGGDPALGNTLMIEAIHQGHADCVKFLAKRGGVAVDSIEGANAVQALTNHHYATAAVIVQHQHVHPPGYFRISPNYVRALAMYGKIELLRMACARFRPLTSDDVLKPAGYNLQSPLLELCFSRYGCDEGLVQTLEFLLRVVSAEQLRGAKIEPIHAILGGSPAVYRTLYRAINGEDLTLANLGAETAELHMEKACRFDSPGIIYYLRDIGYFPDQLMPLLDVTVRRRSFGALTALWACYGWNSDALFANYKVYADPVIFSVVDLGADVRSCNDSSTPTALSVLQSLTGLDCSALRQHRAPSINGLHDDDDRSALLALLLLAFRNLHFQVIQELFQMGATLDEIKCAFSVTLFHTHNRSKKLIFFLRDICALFHWSPSHLASLCGITHPLHPRCDTEFYFVVEAMGLDFNDETGGGNEPLNDLRAGCRYNIPALIRRAHAHGLRHADWHAMLALARSPQHYHYTLKTLVQVFNLTWEDLLTADCTKCPIYWCCTHSDLHTLRYLRKDMAFPWFDEQYPHIGRVFQLLCKRKDSLPVLQELAKQFGKIPWTALAKGATCAFIYGNLGVLKFLLTDVSAQKCRALPCEDAAQQLHAAITAQERSETLTQQMQQICSSSTILNLFGWRNKDAQ